MFAIETFDILDKKLSAFRDGLNEALEKMGRTARLQSERLAARKNRAHRHGSERVRAVCNEALSKAERKREKVFRKLSRTLDGLSDRLSHTVSETTAWI